MGAALRSSTAPRRPGARVGQFPPRASTRARKLPTPSESGGRDLRQFAHRGDGRGAVLLQESCEFRRFRQTALVVDLARRQPSGYKQAGETHTGRPRHIGQNSISDRQHPFAGDGPTGDPAERFECGLVHRRMRLSEIRHATSHRLVGHGDRARAGNAQVPDIDEPVGIRAKHGEPPLKGVPEQVGIILRPFRSVVEQPGAKNELRYRERYQFDGEAAHQRQVTGRTEMEGPQAPGSAREK